MYGVWSVGLRVLVVWCLVCGLMVLNVGCLVCGVESFRCRVSGLWG